MNKLKEINKVDGLAIATLITGAKAIVSAFEVKIGFDTNFPAREEDSSIILLVGLTYLDENGELTGYHERADYLNIRTKSSVIGTTDYMSETAKVWFVNEICCTHKIEEFEHLL